MKRTQAGATGAGNPAWTVLRRMREPRLMSVPEGTASGWGPWKTLIVTGAPFVLTAMCTWVPGVTCAGVCTAARVGPPRTASLPSDRLLRSGSPSRPGSMVSPSSVALIADVTGSVFAITMTRQIPTCMLLPGLHSGGRLGIIRDLSMLGHGGANGRGWEKGGKGRRSRSRSIYPWS